MTRGKMKTTKNNGQQNTAQNKNGNEIMVYCTHMSLSTNVYWVCVVQSLVFCLAF
jgi:hypothetical protein